MVDPVVASVVTAVATEVARQSYPHLKEVFRKCFNKPSDQNTLPGSSFGEWERENADKFCSYYLNANTSSEPDLRALHTALLVARGIPAQDGLLHELLARLAASSNPQSSALHAMSIIRIMSPEDARLFLNACSIALPVGGKGDPFIPSWSMVEQLIPTGPTYSDLAKLDALNLLRLQTTVKKVNPVPVNAGVNHYRRICTDDPYTYLLDFVDRSSRYIPCWFFTPAGTRLYHAANQPRNTDIWPHYSRILKKVEGCNGIRRITTRSGDVVAESVLL